jgi:hypothetical protein
MGVWVIQHGHSSEPWSIATEMMNESPVTGEKSMKSKVTQTACLSLVFVIALLTVFFETPTRCYGFEIIIDVAPNVLNIQREGHLVTVHTDIVYGEVDVFTVYLNGVAINSWKADNRGYFVAKFLMSDIEGLPLEIDDLNKLQLVGATTADESFCGVQEILVVNNVPVGAK